MAKSGVMLGKLAFLQQRLRIVMDRHWPGAPAEVLEFAFEEALSLRFLQLVDARRQELLRAGG